MSTRLSAAFCTASPPPRRAGGAPRTLNPAATHCPRAGTGRTHRPAFYRAAGPIPWARGSVHTAYRRTTYCFPRHGLFFRAVLFLLALPVGIGGNAALDPIVGEYLVGVFCQALGQ